MRVVGQRCQERLHHQPAQLLHGALAQVPRRLVGVEGFLGFQWGGKSSVSMRYTMLHGALAQVSGGLVVSQIGGVEAFWVLKGSGFWGV